MVWCGNPSRPHLDFGRHGKRREEWMDERRIRRMILVGWVLSLVLVVTASLEPEPDMPMPFSSADKVYHWAAYAWLALLPFFAFKGTGAWSAALSMILLGAGLEAAQSFVPGRYPSIMDVVANTVGVITGILVALIVRPLLPGRWNGKEQE
jgi:VanZ family protein